MRPTPARTSLVALFVASTARADEQADPPRVKLSGFVDTYLAINANRPADSTNFAFGAGTTARRANEFGLNLALVDLVADPKPVGFHLALGYGSGVDVLHAADPILAVGHQSLRSVVTATVTGKPTEALTLEAGVYPSHIGLEVLASKDNWTYSRGWMGELSPYYQSGIKAHYAFTDEWAAELHLLNGWSNLGENNEGKAFGAQFSYGSRALDSGRQVLAVYLNGFAGPELPNDGEHWRFFGDLVAVWKPTEALSLAFTTDYGRQSLPGGAVADWYAGGLLLRFARDSVAVVGRAELYRDDEGFITGQAQTLTEGTLTLELKAAEALLFKLEGRYDHSNAPNPVFSRSGRDAAGAPLTTNDQALLVAGAVATF